jgi:glycosyltransferase involved in cell wall biosynthesis
MNKIVSIVIVVKNEVKTIEGALISILEQTYKNIEIIVIDGGSTDGTKQILDQYKINFKVYISEEDSGPSDAINKGIKNSQGEYVYLLYADDWVPADFILKSVKELESDMAIQYVFGVSEAYDKNGEFKFKSKSTNNFYEKLKYNMTINSTTVLYKRKCFEERMYSSSFKIANDYEFFLYLKSKGIKGLYNDNIITYYRLGGYSTIYKYRARREILKASVHYGANGIIAASYFLLYTLNLIVYDVLTFTKIRLLLKWVKLKFKV